MGEARSDLHQVLFVAAVAAVAWTTVAVFFAIRGMDWLGTTDCGWYMRDSLNPGHFDMAILPGYGILVWLALQIAVGADPQLVAQALSLVSFVGSAVLGCLILRNLKSSLAVEGALLFGLFPLTGVANSVMPRVDASVYLVCLASAYVYLKGYRWALVALLAYGLLHQYVLWFFVPFIALVGLSERRLRIWHVLIVGLPLLAYWAAGSVYHGSLLWLVARKARDAAGISTFPIADGLISSLIRPVGGGVPQMARSALLLIHFGMAWLLLASKVWKTRLVLLALIIPTIALGLVLPADEAWSMRDYTMFLALPFTIWLGDRQWAATRNRVAWGILLVFCWLSQFVWAEYLIRLSLHR